MNSIQKTARVAGGLYLLLAAFGAFGILYPPSLMVPGDAAATAGNIVGSEWLFRLSIVSGLVGQTIFIFLVLVLFTLLKPVDKNHARLMVVLALLSVPITMLNAASQAAALIMLSGAEYLTVFTADQLNAQAMFFLDLAEHGVAIAEIFWGLWLFPFGYLVFKSGFLPRILGVFLMIGCFGYLFDFFAFFLFPGFASEISGITGLGELFIMLWLLIKGVDVEQWGKYSTRTLLRR